MQDFLNAHGCERFCMAHSSESRHPYMRTQMWGAAQVGPKPDHEVKTRVSDPPVKWPSLQESVRRLRVGCAGPAHIKWHSARGPAQREWHGMCAPLDSIVRPQLDYASTVLEIILSDEVNRRVKGALPHSAAPNSGCTTPVSRRPAAWRTSTGQRQLPWIAACWTPYSPWSFSTGTSTSSW